MAKNAWFKVDKTGLSKILARRGKSFIVYELLQNAWDQNVSEVEVFLEPVGRQKVKLVVTDDDPKGFEDLAHTFTLFAESNKKADPTKRGRFNVGEKLVLACCEEAQVLTTTGGVEFAKSGDRKKLRKKTEKGSQFSAVIKLNKSEYQEVCESIDRLIPPIDIITKFNGKLLKTDKPITSFEASLSTEIGDKAGYLKKSTRKTTLNIYRVKQGQQGFLYELGIPVVETGDTYHVDVQQKVPLNMDRDNVTPAYIRRIRTLVLNHTYDLLREKDVNKPWVREAASNSECKDEAVTKTLDLRFGKNRVIYDPSDLEANKKAVSKGYSVIHGSQLSKEEWHNVRRGGTTLPAGQVTPAKPQKKVEAIKVEPTTQMERVIRFSKALAKKLMGVNLTVSILQSEASIGADYKATGNGAHLRYNLARLEASFFNDFPNNMEKVIDLLIHEFGHQYSGDHLSAEYHKALTNLGAKLTILAINEPELFLNV
jgi:hypothetical protein